MEAWLQSTVSATFILHNIYLPGIVCDIAWTFKCVYNRQHFFNQVPSVTKHKK